MTNDDDIFWAALKSDAERRAAAIDTGRRAVAELERQAAAWITVSPILEAHVYIGTQQLPDGLPWNAYTRWSRGRQALHAASALGAALDALEA